MPLSGRVLRLEKVDGHQDIAELHRRVRLRINGIIERIKDERCYEPAVFSI